MRNGLLALVACGLLLVAPTVASGTHSPGGGPDDFVVGSGTFVSPDFRGTVSARSGPAGEDPRGRVRLESFEFFVEASVRCVDVVGNRARVSGIVTRQRFPLEQGHVIVVIEDNHPLPDRITATSVAGPPSELLASTECLVPNPAINPVLSGNFVVHDSSP